MIADDPAAKKLFRQQDAAKAMSEHAIEQKRFGDNRERLKAERQAREAAPVPNKDPAPIKPKKKVSYNEAGDCG